jgi:hypothetical protein
MPIYRATIKGRKKTVLVKADTAAQARDKLVTVKALDSAEMMDAIESGEGVWKPEEDLPEDEAAPAKAAEPGAPASDPPPPPAKPEAKGGQQGKE